MGEEGFGEQMGAIRTLNHDILKEMGIKKIAHRMIILEQIANNQQQIAVINEEGTDNVQNTNTANFAAVNNDDASSDSSSEDSDDQHLYKNGGTATSGENNNTKTSLYDVTVTTD